MFSADIQKRRPVEHCPTPFPVLTLLLRLSFPSLFVGPTKSFHLQGVLGRIWNVRKTVGPSA
jgi:hypothetical protein